ncbi:MAG: chemotaxis protein CheW, partial [Candidatus Binatia bacterium]
MRSSNGGFEFDKRAAGAAKLLVVSIDDGLFGCHLDWVEAVYQETLPAQLMRHGGGRARPFVVHGGAAAAVVDLRELLGLEAALGRVRRPGHLLVRSGTGLLALPIDACAGVRELDLSGHTPLPTRVLRDGGLPLGHLIEFDGRILTVLDPNRLLDDALRAELAPLQAKAQTLLERQARAAVLWEEIRREADAERV